MANTVTVAQIHMLARFTEILKPEDEIKIAFRYSSGNVILYFRDITMTIFPSGAWRSHSTKTGENLSAGVFSGKLHKVTAIDN